MRRLPIVVLFAALPFCSLRGAPGLLNSPPEEVAAVLGKPARQESGKVADIDYERSYYETSGWKTAVLFLKGKAQKFETEKSDGSPITDGESKAIFGRYDVADTTQNAEVHGWRQLAENHFIRGDGRVHIIKHPNSITVFWDDLPRDFW
jgi:hypothetical protein